jgi:FtsP/CotA-like multicopper oxidase with cupredoxin domain/Flp pilus assembly pilin Flp
VFSRRDREATGAAAAAFALLAVVIAFVALIAVAQKDDGGATTVSAGGSPITLSEFKIEPSMISVPTGGSLAITNTGSAVHNVNVEGTDLKTEDIQPGASATLDVSSLKDGTYTIFCAIAGHRAQGMEAMLHVGTGASAAEVAESGSTGKTDAQLRKMNAEMDKVMADPTKAYVDQLTKGANTEGVGNVPLQPKVLADGTKEFHLTTEVVDWEVEPGKTVRAWTYNGMVPGPWIKVSSGDKVKMVVTNELPQSTVVHWHGIEVPNSMDGVPDVTQPPIKPGDTFTYEFVAHGPALGIYHSHHYADHQVPDGLFGVFQIDDVPLPPGVGPATQEVPMVLNDAGAIGLSLNGKSFPATAPIIAKPGETVLVDYENEGLMMHPMHLHGIPQLVVAKDGFPLPAPYMVDTLVIAPGERYTVAVRPTADQVGVWAFHCHILTHAESSQGMFGMVTTFIVKQ